MRERTSEGRSKVTPELEAQLSQLVDLPSPAGVAARIVDLAGDPEADLGDIVTAISSDPALAAKLLLTANSPYYGRRRVSKNLREAIMVLGLNATITLALGFSLIKSLDQPGTGSVDYFLIWRRALLSAIASDAIARVKLLPRKEEVFLASLLQDIGILALDRGKTSFYANLPEDADHEMLKAYEREKIGTSHAVIGAWLMRRWNIPTLICDAVEQSHLLESAPFHGEVDALTLSVAVSGVLCDTLLTGEAEQRPDSSLQDALDVLSIDGELLDKILALIRDRIPETEELFEMSIMPPEQIEAIILRAREVLLQRNMQMIEQCEQLKDQVAVLQMRTADLERAARTDPLTRVFDRGYLNEQLRREFQQATEFRWPLSVIFLDLDRFKQINDKYGHQAGDTVLVATAQLLKNGVRDSDLVGRYGGEEFLVLLPGTDRDGAVAFANRIASAIRRQVHHVGDERVQVTTSIGIATHSENLSFPDCEKLTNAADIALFTAKRGGRDRVSVYDPQTSS